MERLRIEKPSCREEIKYALDAALLLGFQTESAVFPAAAPDGKIRVPKTEEELLSLWRLSGGMAPPEDYVPAQKTGPVFELDFREKKGLEYLFSRGVFLKDEDHDLLPDTLDVKLVLPEDVDETMLAAACNVAFRFGMETTAYEGSILAPEGYEGNAVVFSCGDKAEVTFTENADAVQVHITGRGEALTELTNLLCGKFPLTDGVWKSWRDTLMEFVDDFAMRGADGQLAYLHVLQKEQRQKEYLKGSEILDCKSGKKVYERNYELPWEVDIFEQVLRDEVYPGLKSGDKVRIEGAVSEDAAVRNRMSGRIQREIQQAGAVPEGIQIVCAYKQGFSWIDEVVLPAVQG